MKKLLVMISAFVLTTVSTNQLIEGMISTNIFKPIIKNDNKKNDEFQQLNDSTQIDFNKVENYFKDEKNNSNNKFIRSNNNLFKNENSINTAFAKSLEYTREFKEKNLSLNKIITKFQNEIPKFKTVFERELKKQTKINDFNFKSIYENKSPKFNNEEEEKLKLEAAEFWNKLNNIKNILATSIAISAIAAAGFWTVSWLGGISIPWAVAATTATGAMGIMLSALNIYLYTTNPYMNEISQAISIQMNAGLLVYEFVSTVIKFFTIGTITLSATYIIMPVFTAVTAVVITLYYWVNKTDIFKQLDINQRFNDNINEINVSNSKYEFNHTLKHQKNIASGTNINKSEVKEVKLLNWTKYDVSFNEFKKNVKGLFLVNSKAFTGDSEDFKERKDIIIPMHELISNREHDILDKIYDPFIGCREHNRLSHLSRVEGDYIVSKFYFNIETTCWKINYVKLAYQTVAHRYILLLINSLMENNIQITLENIINYFSLSKLGTIIDINNQENLDLFSSFKLNDIKGLYYRLSIYNEQLKKSIGIQNDLTKIVKNHKVILFSLNSLSYPELASNIGKLLIQDLKEFASIKPQNKHINLVLDEFNVFASDSIINLINKTRSFNYQCFLCFQVTDDLSTDKKKLLNTIFGNVGNIIAHKVSDVESPEYIAKVFGTRTVEKITKQYDTKNKKSSKGSIREVEEYIVHPNDLKRLKTGQAYCKILLTNANQFIKKIEIKKFEKDK